MKKYSRVCAYIDLDAIAYNMEQMKKRIGEDGKLIAVIKTDGYGHGAVPLAKMFEEMPYIWGYAVACMGEAAVLREQGTKADSGTGMCLPGRIRGDGRKRDSCCGLY